MPAAKTTKKAAAPNMFATAEVVAAPKKASGKVDTRPRHLMGDLENLALINAAQESLKGVKEVFEKRVKDRMKTIFVTEGMLTKRRPVNFRGFERTAEASCELRKRGDNSPLNELEIAAFEKAGIPTKDVVIVPERFIINPVYADNQKLLAKISAALQGVEGIPADLFQRQAEEVKVCVPEEAMDKLFQISAETDDEKKFQVERLLDSVCVLAVKTEILEEVNPTEILAGAVAILKAEKEAQDAKGDAE